MRKTGPLSRREWLQTVAGAATIGAAGCLQRGGDSGGTVTTNPQGTAQSQEDKWELTVPRPSKSSVVTQIFKGIRGTVRDAGSQLAVELVGADYSDGGMRSLGEERSSSLEATLAAEPYGYAAYHSKKINDGIDFSGDKAVTNKPLQVFGVYTTDVWWVTRSDDISTFDDLSGAKVGMPLGNVTGVPETGAVFKALLSGAGVLSDVELVDTNYGDIPDALEAGDIDVAPNLLRGTTAPAFMRQHSPGLQVVRLTESHKQAFRDSPVGSLRQADLNRIGAYARNRLRFDKGQVQTTAFDVMLFVEDRQGTDVVNPLTKHPLQAAKDISIMTGAVQNFTPEQAAKLLASDMPVHPGAASYLKKNGLWRDELSTPSQ